MQAASWQHRADKNMTTYCCSKSKTKRETLDGFSTVVPAIVSQMVAARNESVNGIGNGDRNVAVIVTNLTAV